MVLFPDTEPSQAHDILQRLQRAMRSASRFAMEGKHLTFSRGLAPVASYAELKMAMQRADTSRYAAKGAGRDRVIAAR